MVNGESPAGGQEGGSRNRELRPGRPEILTRQRRTQARVIPGPADRCVRRKSQGWAWRRRVEGLAEASLGLVSGVACWAEARYCAEGPRTNIANG